MAPILRVCRWEDKSGRPQDRQLWIRFVIVEWYRFFRDSAEWKWVLGLGAINAAFAGVHLWMFGAAGLFFYPLNMYAFVPFVGFWCSLADFLTAFREKRDSLHRRLTDFEALERWSRSRLEALREGNNDTPPFEALPASHRHTSRLEALPEKYTDTPWDAE